jgi:hypothetical protein
MATAPRRIAPELHRLAGPTMDRRHLPRRLAPVGILAGIGFVAAVGIERVWAAVEARRKGGERRSARAPTRVARTQWAHRRASPGGNRYARSHRPPLDRDRRRRSQSMSPLHRPTRMSRDQSPWAQSPSRRGTAENGCRRCGGDSVSRRLGIGSTTSLESCRLTAPYRCAITMPTRCRAVRARRGQSSCVRALSAVSTRGGRVFRPWCHVAKDGRCVPNGPMLRARFSGNCLLRSGVPRLAPKNASRGASATRCSLPLCALRGRYADARSRARQIHEAGRRRQCKEGRDVRHY